VAKRGETSLSLFLEWSSSILGMPTAQGVLVASTLSKILSGLLASHPDALLGKLDYLSPANLDQVLSWNNSYLIQPVERCIHNVIADQILKHPDAEAICAWDGSLMYGELDDIASRLAVQLVRLGVGPEVLVPLCFDKSVRGVFFHFFFISLHLEHC
jgi:non-ribosomal peptide synthetase component F